MMVMTRIASLGQLISGVAAIVALVAAAVLAVIVLATDWIDWPGLVCSAVGRAGRSVDDLVDRRLAQRVG